MTPDQKAHAKRWASMGYKPQAIADELGVSTLEVRRVIYNRPAKAKPKPEPKPVHVPVTCEHRRAVADLLAKGYSLRVIQANFEGV